jgi:hypothetical protein
MIDGINKGQEWTGTGGMGPLVVIEGIDLTTQEVVYRYEPRDPRYPTGRSGVEMFLRSYRLISGQ